MRAFRFREWMRRDGRGVEPLKHFIVQLYELLHSFINELSHIEIQDRALQRHTRDVKHYCQHICIGEGSRE